jgi:hypothetical protein
VTAENGGARLVLAIGERERDPGRRLCGCTNWHEKWLSITMKHETLQQRWKSPEVGPPSLRLVAVDGIQVSFVVAVKIGTRNAIAFLPNQDSGASVETPFVARQSGQNN